MKKVLVTGATGFIGNHVIAELIRHGCRVVATSVNEEKAKAQNWFSVVKYLPFNFDDFNNDINYYTFFDKPDLMIHLAWEGLPNYKESFHTEKNLPAQKAFLMNLIENGLTDITITGTCFEYGMKDGMLSEDMPTEPANPYAIAKDELRKWLEARQASFPFHLKWVRLFYMYGEGQSPKSLISQLEKALENGETEFRMSGGEQVRDFLPITKVAAYIVKIALQQKIEGIINCCSGEPVKVKDFVAEYLKERNKNISLHLGYYPYADYEAMRFWGDDSKLKQVIDND